MDFTNLLRAVDAQHDAYQGRVIELFNQYRDWVVEAANDKRDALIQNDADYLSNFESAQQVLNETTTGIDDETNLEFAAAQKAFDEYALQIAKARDETTDAINRANAARDARSYEWLCVQLQIAKHDFNIKLIDAITEFAA